MVIIRNKIFLMLLQESCCPVRNSCTLNALVLYLLSTYMTCITALLIVLNNTKMMQNIESVLLL